MEIHGYPHTHGNPCIDKLIIEITISYKLLSPIITVKLAKTKSSRIQNQHLKRHGSGRIYVLKIVVSIKTLLSKAASKAPL